MRQLQTASAKVEGCRLNFASAMKLLRANAQRCRDLAGDATDPDIIRSLNGLASEMDAAAQMLERRSLPSGEPKNELD